MWAKNKDILTPRGKRNGAFRFHEVKVKSLFQFSGSLLILFILYYFLLLPNFSTSRKQVADEELLVDVVYAHKKSSINEAVLITTTGYTQIPSSVMGEDNKMFYTKGGSGYPFFFMTGDDRKDTNAASLWNHDFEILNILGTFYAVDMINYGNSLPGPTTKQRHILEDEHSSFYSYFIQNTLNVPEKRIVLIARGKSAALTIKAANRMEGKIAGLILIAPILDKKLIHTIANTPTLLVWSKDDNISNFQNANQFLEICNNVTPLFFETVTDSPGISKSLSHQPDLMRNSEFYSAIKNWIQFLKIR